MAKDPSSPDTEATLEPKVGDRPEKEMNAADVDTIFKKYDAESNFL